MSQVDEEVYSTMFNALRHGVRRRILRMLSEKQMTFTAINENLSISSSHLTYHIDSLKELVSKNNSDYRLSVFGRAAVGMMENVENPPNQMDIIRGQNLLKVISGLLIITIVAVSALSVNLYTISNRHRELNIAYRLLQENLNQTQLELNNVSDRLVEAYERIDEQSEERAETIQAVLHNYDLWIEYWESLGVQPGDLALKSDISPLYSFVIVYPESLVPDEYAEAILRICRQAITEISQTFGLKKRVLNKRILIVMFPIIAMFPTEEDYWLGVNRETDVIIMTLRTQDLTEYTKNHISDFTHTVAHLFAPLGDEFSQGWATYASARVFWDVVEGLGDDVWPTRVNVTEEKQKVLQMIEEGEDPDMRATRVFFEIDHLYGPEIIGDALGRLPSIWEEPFVTWPELMQAIIDVTGEPEIITAIFIEQGFT
jgi:hypothetical protein